MSIKTFALAGGLAGAMFAAGDVLAADVSSGPAQLSHAELDNVTAGVDRIRARVNFRTFTLNAEGLGPNDGFGSSTIATDDTVFSGAGQITAAILAQTLGGYSANMLDLGGDGNVRLQDLRTFARIDY